MFWTIFLAVLALVSAVSAGWVKENKSPSKFIILLMLTATFLFFSSYIAQQERTKWKLATPDNLDEKTIYQVVGRMKMESREKEVLALANGKGDIRYIESKPLPANTIFVKIAVSRGVNELEPINQPWPDPNSNDTR